MVVKYWFLVAVESETVLNKVVAGRPFQAYVYGAGLPLTRTPTCAVSPIWIEVSGYMTSSGRGWTRTFNVSVALLSSTQAFLSLRIIIDTETSVLPLTLSRCNKLPFPATIWPLTYHW